MVSYFLSIFLLIFVNVDCKPQLIPQLLQNFQRNGGDQMNLGQIFDNLGAGSSRNPNFRGPIDIGDADILGHLRGANNENWSPRARRFCYRFPRHPKCHGGRLPQFSEISTIINTVVYELGEILPKVPYIDIKDPLSGLNNELSQFIRSLQSQFGQLSSRQQNQVQNTCKNFKCDQQSAKNVQDKHIVMSKVMEFDKSVGMESKEKANLRFDRTLQVKQAMLQKANLSKIVIAADNGVFDKDLLLTENQANFLLNELGQAGVGTNAPPQNGHRNSRAALFLQEHPVQKWDIWHPIPYTFDDSLEESDKQDVRNALHAISIKTCILFKYDPNPKGNHLKYLKVDSTTFCGLSYIGRTDPANPIYLSFQCGDNRGVAIHETMHALGVNHEHLRLDRDKFIKIDWSNIDPQHYDIFSISDAKLYSSYGTNYAYDSIMHYDAHMAAIDPSKPTMIPLADPAKNSPKLGQRKTLSWADIKLLKKMYCRPGCEDQNVHCGTWALNGYCKSKKHVIWMSDNCKASCDKC